MESSLLHCDIRVSGKTSSGSTVLFSDIFDLFPGTFRQLATHFEDNNQVIIYSDLGFKKVVGRRQLRYETLNGYADDLIRFLESRHISNITYIAHSVNAMMAFIAAIKAPHLFSRLVLTSAFAFLQPDAEAQYLCGLQAYDADSLFNCLMKKEYTTSQPSHLPNHYIAQLTDILRDAFAGMNEEEARSIFRLLLATDCRSFLGNLSVPAIILQVASDRIATSEAGYFLYRTIPNSQLVRIKAKGQLPQVDAPLEIVQAMKFFITTPF